jgi:hypothetical protein
MNLFVKDANVIEKVDDLGNALVQMIEENLDVKRWGFHLTYKNFARANEIVVVYNSQWCKINFTFSRQRIPQHDELSIEYGRLHAPNEEPFMVWEGEKCRCWHNVLDPLRFLDGLSPNEAAEQVMTLKQLPHVVRDFRESAFGKKLLEEYPPKSAIVLQSILWKHYNDRLFELFDIRHPKLWNSYRKFIKEYYALLGMKASYGPPYENIC